MTEILKVERHESDGSHMVCKGKLVLIKTHAPETEPHIYLVDAKKCIKLNHCWYKPIMISETEEAKNGQWGYCMTGDDKGKDIVNLAVVKNADMEIHSHKVLALPENFSSKHLSDIVDGKIKNGDELFVECEYMDDGWDEKSVVGRLYQIKLIHTHIKLFPLPSQKEGWDEIFEHLDVCITEKFKETYLAIRDELKDKYNTPTRKHEK